MAGLKNSIISKFCQRIPRLKKRYYLIFVILVFWCYYLKTLRNTIIEEQNVFVKEDVRNSTFESKTESTNLSETVKNPLKPPMKPPLKIKTLKNVLIVTKTSKLNALKPVTDILNAHRIDYISSKAGQNLPELIEIHKNLGKYSVIIFEDYDSYLNMDPKNRKTLDKYCISYNVGIISFILPSEKKQFNVYQLKDKSQIILDLPLLNIKSGLKSFKIKKNASVLHMTKSGIILLEDLIQKEETENSFMTFSYTNLSNYETIAFGNFKNSIIKEPTIILDNGLQDKIPKILIGSGLDTHWLNKLLFLDTLKFLSKGG